MGSLVGSALGNIEAPSSLFHLAVALPRFLLLSLLTLLRKPLLATYYNYMKIFI